MTTSWHAIRGFGRSLLQGFVQLLYPNSCWVCSAFTPPEQGSFCETCLPELARDPFPTCPRCAGTVGPNLILDKDKGCPDCRNKTFAFDRVFRMAPYDGLLREVILRMKHWSGEDLVEVIGGLWAKQMEPHLSALQPNVVIPVPLHWSRFWWRGFNQSTILANCLAQQLGISCDLRSLRRIRRTDQQKQQQTVPQRQENVRNAFQAFEGGNLANKVVLLVDDVLTSGATANESARALRVLRPREIHVVVLAHGR